MKTKAVLFDMDGVLVDVSNSYRLVVKKTLEHFLNCEISPGTIQQYKNRSGLNNDWDLTERILYDYGLKVEKDKIIRVFQRFYLGNNYDGLIQQEQWLLSLETLNWICQHFKTGIVTGRPGDEALYTLKRFKVQHFFQVVVVMEDVPRDRGKPDPLGIQLALEKLQVTDGWYLGDTIDDMIAGKKAGLIPIGVVNNKNAVMQHHQEELLRKYGAVEVLNAHCLRRVRTFLKKGSDTSKNFLLRRVKCREELK
jgi:HAD superfamily phosphatase